MSVGKATGSGLLDDGAMMSDGKLVSSATIHSFRDTLKYDMSLSNHKNSEATRKRSYSRERQPDWH